MKKEKKNSHRHDATTSVICSNIQEEAWLDLSLKIAQSAQGGSFWKLRENKYWTNKSLFRRNVAAYFSLIPNLIHLLQIKHNYNYNNINLPIDRS